jgi:hypothetical protein
LPSSPHWAPTMTADLIFGTSDSTHHSPQRAARDLHTGPGINDSFYRWGVLERTVYNKF